MCLVPEMLCDQIIYVALIVMLELSFFKSSFKVRNTQNTVIVEKKEEEEKKKYAGAELSSCKGIVSN